MLVDWDIPFDQLDMDESKPLSGGRFGTKCYIGKWHGECNIRRVDINDDPGTSGCIEKTKYINQFKSELLNYKKTRHDNVELFLGACLKQPNLAIVTRNYRGWRLDNHITESPPSLDHARMIAEHVCQGIGYLHSKNIVHRDLRPANVMFDQAGKAVIKGLGLSTLAAITGEGSIIFNQDSQEYSLTLPRDWVFRLAPELATGIPCDRDCSIISKLNYTKQSDIYAFGVLWAELMQAVHRSSFTSSRRKPEETIILSNPPTSENLEDNLYRAGLGNKPDVPDPLQDTARNIINKCCDRSSDARPTASSLSDLLAKVLSTNKLTRRWTDRRS